MRRPSVNESWLAQETGHNGGTAEGGHPTLRDHGQPQSEWLDAISSDQTISDLVRQRALQFARDWKP